MQNDEQSQKQSRRERAQLRTRYRLLRCVGLTFRGWRKQARVKPQGCCAPLAPAQVSPLSLEACSQGSLRTRGHPSIWLRGCMPLVPAWPSPQNRFQQPRMAPKQINQESSSFLVTLGKPTHQGSHFSHVHDVLVHQSRPPATANGDGRTLWHRLGVVLSGSHIQRVIRVLQLCSHSDRGAIRRELRHVLPRPKIDVRLHRSTERIRNGHGTRQPLTFASSNRHQTEICMQRRAIPDLPHLVLFGSPIKGITRPLWLANVGVVCSRARVVGFNVFRSLLHAHELPTSAFTHAHARMHQVWYECSGQLCR